MSSLLTFWKVNSMITRFWPEPILIKRRMRSWCRFIILKMDRLVCGPRISFMIGCYWWMMLWRSMKIIWICFRILLLIILNPFCLASVFIVWKDWHISWIIPKICLLLELIAWLLAGCIWIWCLVLRMAMKTLMRISCQKNLTIWYISLWISK